MHPRFTSALAYGAVVAAACASALMHVKAYAESPTIDNTPFASTRTRAEVRAEVLASHPALAWGEASPQSAEVPRVAGNYTRADAMADLRASREEMKALTGEDSGSSYLAQQMYAPQRGTAVARAR